jgi:molybdate transport system permease protein
VRPDAGFADLRQALADGRLVKLADREPGARPYGRAAMEALKSAGLWSAIEPKLVLGENVSQAAQFAVSGSTQAGIFALSLALAPNFRDAGSYVPIPEALHRPLRQAHGPHPQGRRHGARLLRVLARTRRSCHLQALRVPLPASPLPEPWTGSRCACRCGWPSPRGSCSVPTGVLAGRWLARSTHPLKPIAEATLAPAADPSADRARLLPPRSRSAAQSPVGQLYASVVGIRSRSPSRACSSPASSSTSRSPGFRPARVRGHPGGSLRRGPLCGLSRWRTLWRIELPLAWRGILSGLIMTVAHTLGEFGVVLMVGGSIPGETRTVAISIYDRVQAFDLQAAGSMSAILLAASLATLLATVWLTRTRPSVRRAVKRRVARC